MWIDFGMDAAVDGVVDQLLDGTGSGHSCLVVLAGGGDQLRQPMRMCCHPSKLAGGERGVSLFGARVFDAVPIKVLDQLFLVAKFVHAGRAAKLSG